LRVTKETAPIRAKLKFRTDSTARSGLLEPRDFAIEAQQAGTKPGADPNEVGPHGWER
jgi:hypothetical protein